MRKTLTLFLLLAMWASMSFAQDGASRRSGFWLNVGLGYGSADWMCDNCNDVDRASGVSGQIALGATLSPQFLLGVESNGWAGSDVWGGIDNAMLGTFAAVVYFYPGAATNFFVKGGAGIASFRFEEGSWDDSDTGFGFLVGAGYDIPLGSKYSITPVFTYQYGLMGDWSGAQGITQNVLSIGATFTLH